MFIKAVASNQEVVTMMIYRSEVARAPTSLHEIGVTEVKKDGVSGIRGGQ